MFSYLQKLLRRRTIARDLTFGLVLLVTVAFSLLGAVNYFYSIDRDTKALKSKAYELMENLAEVLVTPLWNLDEDEIKKILDVYLQSDIVISIQLINDENHQITERRRSKESSYLEISRVVDKQGQPIGKVTVAFSGAHIVDKQRETAWYTGVTFLVIILVIVFATSFLLNKFLTEPFAKLTSGLEVIAGGDYSHVMETVLQRDINTIITSINTMAREISRRERALVENRSKLEILNQAILDIFSCSDTETLIRTIMSLTHKVCGVEKGWFMAKKETTTQTEGEVESLPIPLLVVKGQTFEATESEVSPYITAADGVTAFCFDIKSRHRTVGTMALSFDRRPDASESSLLKSIMSLANLAMIRQSFIRETAFITAELQVAETVQRSMLPDASRAPQSADVSFHYEPVLRVGGDWFSCFESSGGNALYVILGDVTGHGLAQGLVTTAVSGAVDIVENLINTYDDHALNSPAQIVSLINNVIGRIAGKSNLRMTCVAVKIDFATNKLYVCNAGHTFPIMIRQNESKNAVVEPLVKKQQPMLGDEAALVRGHRYENAEYDFSEEARLLLYTDGLTEALDPHGRAFNRSLMRHFNGLTDINTVDGIRDRIVHLFQQHTFSVPVKDDICLIAVAKKPESSVTGGDGRTPGTSGESAA